MRISRRYTFQSAHRLPNVLPGHKCARLHGHTYELEVEVEGPIDPTLGWVLDYAHLDALVKTVVLDTIDHRYLNEIAGLENPTSEILAQWIFDRLAATSFGPARVVTVSVGENSYSKATACASTSAPTRLTGSGDPTSPRSPSSSASEGSVDDPG